jgi:diadenylate cyclase
MSEVGNLMYAAIEVTVFAVMLYLVLRFLRETRGSGVVRGLALLLVSGLVGAWLLIDLLDLAHLKLLFGDLLQSVLIAIVIIFHPEIRRAIVHLGDSPIFGRFFKKESKIVQRVLRALARMSKERIGALIAIEREGSLQALAESGVTIDAELNSFLIESIFYPKSALHDGAIVVRDDRIVAASCLLPLSQNPDVDRRLGTRHRAALGLSEETDALAIVVSEETGKLSTAMGGKLSFDLTLEQVERRMDEALGQRQRSVSSERRRHKSVLAAIVSDPLRKLAAVLLGIGLYFLLDLRITDTVTLSATVVAVAVDETPPESGDQVRITLPTDIVGYPRFVNPLAGAENNRLVDNQVKISITGSSYATNAVRAQQGSLVFPVPLPDVDWSKVDNAEFTIADIQHTEQVLLDRKLSMTMEPRSVRIEVDRLKVRDTPMSLEFVELVGNDRLRARLQFDTALFSHDTVQVIGPMTAVDKFGNHVEKPFVADLSTASQHEAVRRISLTVQLQPRYRDQRLRIRNSPVTLTLQLQPVMQEFVLELPVRVDDLALPPELRGRYQPAQQLRQVRINAGGTLRTRLTIMDEEQRARWAHNNLRLSVYLQPRESIASYPAEMTEIARLEPVPDLASLVGAGEYELLDTVPVVLQRVP